jgi:hypothetical protein
LVPIAAGEEPLTPIARINKSLKHQEITVQAVVSRVTEPQNGSPYHVTLSQGGAAITLIYWPDMQAQLGPKVRPGNTIRAKVTVDEFRDELELRIRDSNAIELVGGVMGAPVSATPAPTAPPAPTPTPTATPAPTPAAPATPPVSTVIGDIKADWADRAVIISGTVSDFQIAGKVWQLKVQDRTGEIAATLGEKVLAGLTVTELKPGWVVAITGPVKVYDGKPTVVPEAADSVKVTRQ